MANRLSQESSPYLLQHAHNPVDWYPWGEEALERARAEDRPILLSIGYSACHWCHVMERESFEDPGIAAVMNELFVNIKVDREERPDIDQIYMKAVQAMTGGGGWPLTAFLTPDGVPYYGGTYFPPEPRHGMPSFRQVLQAAATAYRDRPEEVRTAGGKLLEALRQAAAAQGGHADAGVGALDAAFAALSRQYDPVHGGFGRAPKFPQPVTLELLLRHHLRTGDPRALEMVVHTLRRMAAGGLRDHLGGGFHRYSVDARWLVPHFEKMLYDNALLARVYLDAFRATGDGDLRAIAEDTLDYMASDLLDAQGGFYAARDADSEGEEGLFYVWEPSQVDAVLDPEDAALFKRLYDVTDAGNFEGRNILHLPHEPAAVAASTGLEPRELGERMEHARARLLKARAEREAPFRDEKVLTSWSAMAVRAFAEAGATLGRADYVEVAERGADFLCTHLRPGGQLKRSWKDGRARIPAFLEDFAALGNALLSVHAATLQPRWLDTTRTLVDEMLARFWDEDQGTVFDTPVDGERLILRPRDPMDNATPSGSSLAAELLLRAGHLFDDRGLEERALSIFRGDRSALERYGPAFGRMLSALDRSLAPPLEIAIVGPRDSAATRDLVQAAHAHSHRNATVAGFDPDDGAPATPLLEGRTMVEGRAAAYVCRGYACRLPVSEPEALAAEIAAVTGDD